MRAFAKLILVALALCAGTASAQTYPSKPVRVVIPFAPGGSSDTILRPLAEKLGAALGQPFVVETKAGGQTVIGGEIVAKAPPDGYTLYMMAGTHVLLPHLLKTVPFDTQKDFAPVAFIATQPYVLMAHPSQPFSTVREMIAYARANPGKLSFGASDIVTRVAVDSLLKQTKIEAPVVSYKGGGPLMNDLLGGHIGVGFGSALLMAYVKDGRLKPLAVSSPARSPGLPTCRPRSSRSSTPPSARRSWSPTCASVMRRSAGSCRPTRARRGRAP